MWMISIKTKSNKQGFYFLADTISMSDIFIGFNGSIYS